MIYGVQTSPIFLKKFNFHTICDAKKHQNINIMKNGVFPDEQLMICEVNHKQNFQINQQHQI